MNPVILLAGAQKIELVGGEGWWQKNGGSVALAIAAITAAAIAAYVAIRNHRQQLAHDRYLRNQDHMRNTIDAALVSANETRNAMDRFMASVETLEEARNENKDISEDFQDEAKGDADESLLRLQAMRAVQVRVETRLGIEHPVATSHRDAFASYNRIFTEVVDGLRANREEQVREGDAEREQVAQDGFEAFQTACHGWFQSLGP